MSNNILHLVQDWLDIDFAIKQGVDFIAVSFVKSAEVINNLKSYLSSRADKVIEIIAKVESHDSVPNLEEIVAASDAVMVARGDLGAQLPRLCLHPVHQSTHPCSIHCSMIFCSLNHSCWPCFMDSSSRLGMSIH